MNEAEEEQRADELAKIIDELIAANETIPVIVEGDRDIASLRRLGLRGAIIKINSGKTLVNTCDEIGESSREAIILTDWDRKGGLLARQVREALESADVRPQTKFRAGLARLCGKEIRDVESLHRHFLNLLEKVKLIAERD